MRFCLHVITAPLICFLLTACGGSGSDQVFTLAEQSEPAEIAIGERLFLETRFAQFFAVNSGGDVNTLLGSGDPVLEQTKTTNNALPATFSGQSINCRACHLVDEQLESDGGGIRTYADFARRSPLSGRNDGQDVAVRNSPTLVNATLQRPEGLLLHFDGEFASLEQLVRDTLTGRMFGWLPAEQTEAIEHIARVIREDDGSGELASEFGGSYASILSGTDPAIPPELVLDEAFRVDVTTASNDGLLNAVAKLISAYVSDLSFSNSSPYDRFLEVNQLPGQPAENESALEYSRRLLDIINSKTVIQFVPADTEREFEFHQQPFQFNESELRGLRVFLNEPLGREITAGEVVQGGIGNCLAYHAAPDFTDFAVHNTGITQLEYDGIHGAEAFNGLNIPDLATRNADPEMFLPATDAMPNATGRFRKQPDISDPGLTDLGVWNVFANDSFPAPQVILPDLLCDIDTDNSTDCNSTAELLNLSVATFKTPGLRDLGHSSPYMHNGQLDSLTDVLEFYRQVADMARNDEIRNADSRLENIALSNQDIHDVVAFLRSLNEDYN